MRGIALRLKGPAMPEALERAENTPMSTQSISAACQGRFSGPGNWNTYDIDGYDNLTA